jgi:hypothetical protein
MNKYELPADGKVTLDYTTMQAGKATGGIRVIPHTNKG